MHNWRMYPYTKARGTAAGSPQAAVCMVARIVRRVVKECERVRSVAGGSYSGVWGVALHRALQGEVGVLLWKFNTTLIGGGFGDRHI